MGGRVLQEFWIFVVQSLNLKIFIQPNWVLYIIKDLEGRMLTLVISVHSKSLLNPAQQSTLMMKYSNVSLKMLKQHLTFRVYPVIKTPIWNNTHRMKNQHQSETLILGAWHLVNWYLARTEFKTFYMCQQLLGIIRDSLNYIYIEVLCGRLLLLCSDSINY